MAWPENVRKTDLDISYYRGSGPGGQHRNKRDTACRIKHIPTGISACAEDCKSQRQNRSKAFRKLAKQLVPLMVPNIEVEKSNERIRTYHEPRQQVKDDRIKDETWSFDDVVYGKGLGKIIRKLNGI
jgi:peptide chain release factor 1